LKTLNGKELALILEKNGWVLKRIHGSHHIYSKDGQIERISIPIHGNASLKIGLLKYLMCIVKLSESDLD